jgi:protein-disulfide isomerase
MSRIQKTIALLLLCLGPVTATATGQEAAGNGSDPFTEAEKAAIGELIRSYILENPEILPEAIGVLQAREQKAERLAMREAVKANRERIERDGISVVQGNPEGDVTIAEFYDYQCTYCRRGHKDVLRLMNEDPDLRVVYKQFPVKDVPGEEPASMIAARMAMAADRQGKFLAFHQAAMSIPMPLSEKSLFTAARNAGLDPEKLASDMEDGAITDSIRANMFLARELGINGTPTYIIGDELVIGAHGYDTLKRVIADTRAAKKSK